MNSKVFSIQFIFEFRYHTFSLFIERFHCGNRILYKKERLTSINVLVKKTVNYLQLLSKAKVYILGFYKYMYILKHVIFSP